MNDEKSFTKHFGYSLSLPFDVIFFPSVLCRIKWNHIHQNVQKIKSIFLCWRAFSPHKLLDIVKYMFKIHNINHIWYLSVLEHSMRLFFPSSSSSCAFNTLCFIFDHERNLREIKNDFKSKNESKKNMRRQIKRNTYFNTFLLCWNQFIIKTWLGKTRKTHLRLEYVKLDTVECGKWIKGMNKRWNEYKFMLKTSDTKYIETIFYLHLNCQRPLCH